MNIGDKFTVPTVDQLIGAGWIRQGSNWHDPKNKGYVMEERDYNLQIGKTLTVDNVYIKNLDWVTAKETGPSTWWPAQAFVDISKQQQGYFSSVPAVTVTGSGQWHNLGQGIAVASRSDAVPRAIECAHVKGQTPLMGWVICKVCGNNLEKWGI